MGGLVIFGGILAIIALAGSGRRRGTPPAPMPPSPPPPAPEEPVVIPPPPDMAFSPTEAEAAQEAFEREQREARGGGGSVIEPSAPDAPAEGEPALLEELTRAPQDVVNVYQTRDPNVVNGPPGSGASPQQVRAAVRRARAAGLGLVAQILQTELERRQRESRRAPGRGGRAPHVDTPSVAPEALPEARESREALHALALRVRDDLNRAGHRAYNRSLMKQFQRGAGLVADGMYGPKTRGALSYYGHLSAGETPPAEY